MLAVDRGCHLVGAGGGGGVMNPAGARLGSVPTREADTQPGAAAAI